MMRPEKKHWRSAAATLLACSLVLTAGIGAASAQERQHSARVVHRHATVHEQRAPKQRLFLRAPVPYNPDVPQRNNPGIPMWDGGCGQCGFIG
jgi:hypothetical protein